MARRKKSKSEIIEDGLMKLATGNIADAVSLLYLSDEEAVERLPKLNLFNVSEIKRPKGGGLEIKFFDRIKAFERLSDNASGEKSEELGFYQALENSIENAEGRNT
ncbi:MAG: hypothetical protein IJ235_06560 [Eubacterium sp.]|nr:hypothetical protein [Eubacterium sp.]MBR1531573.1 hypothetical protein [Eubacterium sp.]MBR2278144.1 hypothetical protein [Eubacterium sp.]